MPARYPNRLKYPTVRASAVHVHGMHGFGDTIMQRAVVRQLLERYTEVWVETPWPFLFHDLPVKLVSKGSRLRTQAKNAQRERAAFHAPAVPNYCRPVHVSYPPQSIRAAGDVLRAMLTQCGCDPNRGDFSLPIPAQWKAQADCWLSTYRKSGDPRPLMVVRPLTERAEWRGNIKRNPLPGDYHTLVAALRPYFYMVSVADLAPGAEWMVDAHSYSALAPDETWHTGEVPGNVLAAIFAQARVVVTAPGFATVLAQAVGTANVTVFGGYQSSRSLASLAKVSPSASYYIDPIKPCDCYSHDHDCQKRIDTAHWVPVLQRLGRNTPCGNTHT